MTEFRQFSGVSVETQCGDFRTVDEDNILVTKRCFSPQQDADLENDANGDDNQVSFWILAMFYFVCVLFLKR